MTSPLLIIGSGPAGYTAAIYGARAGLNPVVLAGPEPGGQLTLTTDVENFPGFPQGTLGPDLMENMYKQACEMGADVQFKTVISVNFKDSPFQCTTSDGHIYHGKSVILATGAQAKWLGLESEVKFRGFGVSSCATCDGPLPVFRNQTIAVVGGGNSAVEEALFLSRYAKEVILIHRRDTLRAERILVDRLMATENIRVLWNHTVQEILGDTTPQLSVTGIIVQDVQTQRDFTLAVRGVFIAIGHRPNTSLFQGILDQDNEGYLLGEGTATSCSGVFKAGDVGDKVYRQAITAAGMGCMAALDAQKYLMHP